MKKLLLNKLLFVLLLVPAFVLGQTGEEKEQDITGLWKGTLYNDTTQKYLPYEVAISEEKGKLSGYSYTMFDINGKKEIGVKRIKLKRDKDGIIIEDVELISNTYSEPPPKKVRVLSIVHLIVNDTAMILSGKWSTNRTREYRPLTGTLQLQRAVDYTPVTLYKLLAALKLDQELSFIKPAITPQPAGIAVNEKLSPAVKKLQEQETNAAEIAGAKTITTPEVKKETAVETRPVDKETSPTGALIAKTDVDKPEKLTAPVEVKRPEPVIKNKPAEKQTKPAETNIAKADADKPAKITSPAAGKGKEPVIENKPINREVKPVDKLGKAPETAQPVLTDLAVADKKPVVPGVKDTAIKKAPAVKELAKQSTLKPASVADTAVVKKAQVTVAVNDSKKEKDQPANTKPATVAPPLVTKKPEPVVAVVNEPLQKQQSSIQEPVKKPALEKPVAIEAPVVSKPAPEVALQDTVKKTAVAKVLPETKKEAPVMVGVPKAPVAAEKLAERKIKNEQSVFFESDSLVFTLYDNGEVDGDTVSVVMNGQLIFAKQGLTTKANSKTIYMDKGMPDTISMVMYAENLGSIPPNTGLMIIMDGEKRYEVRFSADLQTNAAVILRRKPKE